MDERMTLEMNALTHPDVESCLSPSHAAACLCSDNSTYD